MGIIYLFIFKVFDNLLEKGGTYFILMALKVFEIEIVNFRKKKTNYKAQTEKNVSNKFTMNLLAPKS